MKGVPIEDIPEIVNQKILNSRPNNFDWSDYNNVSYGYLSDAYGEFELLVPSFESANKYLDRFEFLVIDNSG